MSELVPRWMYGLVTYVAGSGTLPYMASSLRDAIVAGVGVVVSSVCGVLQRTRHRCKRMEEVELVVVSVEGVCRSCF